MSDPGEMPQSAIQAAIQAGKGMQESGMSQSQEGGGNGLGELGGVLDKILALEGGKGIDVEQSLGGGPLFGTSLTPSHNGVGTPGSGIGGGFGVGKG